MTALALSELASALPGGSLIDDPGLLASYRQDMAADPRAGYPAAVVRARTTGDVQAVLRWASSRRVPVVPRGAGTGLSAGASAVDGCIMLSLELMRDIRIDPVSRVAICQPGAINSHVKVAASSHGLWYPPDPASFESCTIGGNIATNAGGLCCAKYGVTTDYVLGLEVVLADGTAARLGGPRLKDTAGYSLVRLFAGSEGTLGVITEATLRLIPEPPPLSATLVASFPTPAAAAEAVVVISRRIRPAMLELMDHPTINAVEDLLAMGLDRTAGALLIARSDAPGDAATSEIALIESACDDYGATESYRTGDVSEGDAFAHARRSALPALERKGTLLLEDVGVPLTRLPRLVAGIHRIAEANNTTIALIAHAADGNTHPLIVYDAEDGRARTRATTAFREVMELALSLDGTITGEHGVGRLKKAWLPAYLGAEATALNRKVKGLLDPHEILNPGAMF